MHSSYLCSSMLPFRIDILTWTSQNQKEKMRNFKVLKLNFTNNFTHITLAT